MSGVYKQKKSKSSRLGLSMSVARVDKAMRDMRLPKRRVGGTAATYVTAATEIILKDVVQAANKLAMAQASKQLLSRHLQLAVTQNDTLNVLLGNVSIGTRDIIAEPIDHILTKEQQKKRFEKQKEGWHKKAAAAAAAASGKRP